MLGVPGAVLVWWPHLHSDLPAGLDGVVPYFLENELAFGAFKIIMSLQDVWANTVDMHEGLIDETLHGLWRAVSPWVSIDR